MPDAPLPEALPARIVFVFLDGVGLGPTTDHNPFASLALPHFERLAGGQRWTADAVPIAESGHLFRPIDATLGVEGLPQSGTGQATLLTGVNCAARAGRHFGPYPHSTSKPVIAARNLFVRLRDAGRTGAFANAYPDRFFRYAEGRGRWTVTTLCCIEAGVPLRREADLRAGDALTADLTAAAWPEHLGIDVPVISEEAAGRRLARLSHAADLTLFEYYLTDKAGHSQSPGRAAATLRSLDAFFGGLLGALDEGDLLVVTSDHGNLEDLGTKTHTRHPVPLVALGPGAAALAEVGNLMDVTPALVALLTK
ncbi:MAG: alkaline phosphatase family protein [Rhodothermales bacterium]